MSHYRMADEKPEWFADEKPEWFAVDRNGHIGAFNSESGYVPSSVNLSESPTIINFLSNLDFESDYTMDQGASRFRRGMYDKSPIPEEMERFGLEVLEQYFSIISKKGIFSFDNVYSKFCKVTNNYFRVCRPTLPLNISFVSSCDANIAKILNRTSFHCVEFAKCKLLDAKGLCQIE